jgi:hypothetical protein
VAKPKHDGRQSMSKRPAILSATRFRRRAWRSRRPHWRPTSPALTMAMTGRTAYWDELDGDGVTVLRGA